MFASANHDRAELGSNSTKARKAEHSLHVPEVGAATGNERVLHDERRAVGDQMGVGHAGRGVTRVVVVVAVVGVAWSVFMARMVLR
jgi:hypothetical protein